MSLEINESDQNESEHEKVFALLPWWVNQTLPIHEHSLVDTHIKSCDICRQEVSLLSQLHTSVQYDAEIRYETDANVEKCLAMVNGRINSEGSQSASTQPLWSAWQRFVSGLSDFTTIQWGATAIAGLLVSVLGFQVWIDKTDNEYSVLSSSEESASPLQLSVRFTDSISEPEARRILQNEANELNLDVEFLQQESGEFVVSYKDSIDVVQLSNMVNNLDENNAVVQVEIVH